MKVLIETVGTDIGVTKTATLRLQGRPIITAEHNTPGLPSVPVDSDISDMELVGRLHLGLAQFNKEAEETIQECLDNLDRKEQDNV